jgi:hypothetical protein
MASKALRTVLALSASFAALVFCGAGQAKTSCATGLLDDWRDGRINKTYPVECYQAALAEMPEDLRIYSSAETDIRRALLARIEAGTAAKAPTVNSSRGSHGVSPLMLLAIVGAILAALGSVLALHR